MATAGWHTIPSESCASGGSSSPCACAPALFTVLLHVFCLIVYESLSLCVDNIDFTSTSSFYMTINTASLSLSVDNIDFTRIYVDLLLFDVFLSFDSHSQ